MSDGPTEGWTGVQVQAADGRARGPLSEGVAELGAALSALDSTIADLRVRLGPLLAQEPTTADGPPDVKAPPEGCSDVVRAVYGQSTQVRQMTVELRALAERVET